MNIKMLTLSEEDYPGILRNISSPPNPLYYCGPLNELLELPRLAVVGTRYVSAYGRQVTEQLANELAEQGVVIVSGLALGVDAAAQRAALEVNGRCLTVLPGPLDNIVPVSNRRLAAAILEQGGALVSEYAPGTHPVKQNFIARNRLMSGLAQAVLITEAGEKSGAKHTARFALEQGREVMVVPGNIYTPGSVGVHNLLKSGQASAVTSYIDVLHHMKLVGHKTPAKMVIGRNAHEQALLDLMLRGVTAGELLLEQSRLSVIEFNQALTMLEISSKIKPLGANHWAIY